MCSLSEKSICSWSVSFSCLQEKCAILQKESQSFKGACAKWLILCTLMPCFSRVRFLIENAQPLLVCCYASAVKRASHRHYFLLFRETLQCCLIWITIFLWCSTSHKHSPLCTSLLCGMELGQKMLQCSACRLQPFMVHELLVSWCLKHKILLSLLFMLAKCTYCFSMQKIR